MSTSVPHFKPQSVIFRTHIGPLHDMFDAIAARNGFVFTHGNWADRKRMKVQPLIDSINALPKTHKDQIVTELYWLNTIAFTPKVSGAIKTALEAANVTVPEEIQKATLGDVAAWAYARIPQSAWQQICTLARIANIGKKSWTTFVLDGVDDSRPIDTTDVMQAKIKDKVCEFIFNTEGRAESGYCSHYRDESTGEECFRVDMTDFPLLKTIWVKKDLFRKRRFKDVFEVVFTYNPVTHEINIHSDGDSNFDRNLAREWVKAVFGDFEDIEVTLPATDTYKLDFIKYRSGNLPIPEGSHIDSARVVIARAQGRDDSGEGNSWSVGRTGDIHDKLVRAWTANGLTPEDLIIRRIEIDFYYTDPCGTSQRYRYRFTRTNSNYLDAPTGLKADIRTLLIAEGILNVAA